MRKYLPLTLILLLISCNLFASSSAVNGQPPIANNPSPATNSQPATANPPAATNSQPATANPPPTAPSSVLRPLATRIAGRTLSEHTDTGCPPDSARHARHFRANH